MNILCIYEWGIIFLYNSFTVVFEIFALKNFKAEHTTCTSHLHTTYLTHSHLLFFFTQNYLMFFIFKNNPSTCFICLYKNIFYIQKYIYKLQSWVNRKDLKNIFLFWECVQEKVSCCILKCTVLNLLYKHDFIILFYSLKSSSADKSILI